MYQSQSDESSSEGETVPAMMEETPAWEETATAVSRRNEENAYGSKESILASRSLAIQEGISELERLQLQYMEIEAYCYWAAHTLKVKSAEVRSHLLDKRRRIVNGQTNAHTGIPEFWLTVFMNSSKLSSMIKEVDKEVLKYLEDVSVTYVGPRDSMDFVLNFHFKPNDYFTNTVLTKKYLIDCEIDKENPYDFDGPKVVGCRGCEIHWKNGRDLTHYCVRGGDFNREPTFKLIHKDSFFNFFDPLFVDSENEYARSLDDDFEIGEYIRDRIVPRAVWYYTEECYSDAEFYDSD